MDFYRTKCYVSYRNGAKGVESGELKSMDCKLANWRLATARELPVQGSPTSMREWQLVTRRVHTLALKALSTY